MKKKATLFIILILVIIFVGTLSYLALLSESDSKKAIDDFKTMFTETEQYQSTDQDTQTILKLNYSDSTFIYHGQRNMKPGDDMLYETESKGKFKLDQDSLVLYSEMPDNSRLHSYIHALTDEEISKNKFSYIYPIEEKINDSQVKIYFDNIAEVEDYKAFTLDKNQLKPIKILEVKKLSEPVSINTKKDNFMLFHYLLIEKPSNNHLLITDNNSKSFLFDFNKIPYPVFHFYTRVYANFVDLTGLKFHKKENSLILIRNEIDKRYASNQALNSEFIKN